MAIIPTTDALSEPTVMRQIRKLAEFSKENFDELSGTTADGVTLTDKETYFLLHVDATSQTVTLEDKTDYFELTVGE